MAKNTKAETRVKPSAEDDRSRSRVGMFALLAAIGIAAFVIWFIVNGVDDA